MEGSVLSTRIALIYWLRVNGGSGGYFREADLDAETIQLDSR